MCVSRGLVNPYKLFKSLSVLPVCSPLASGITTSKRFNDPNLHGLLKSTPKRACEIHSGTPTWAY